MTTTHSDVTVITRSAAHRSRSSPTPRPAPRCSPTRPLRHYNYYTPQKRKQSHYEDVTVEVQPDPRHYLSQGWLYGFSDGRGRLPARLDRPQGVGRRPAEPERFPGSGGKGYDWPAHGWHEFRDPNEEWELTFYRNNSNVVRQINQNIETARETKAFEQWNPNWVHLRGAQRRRLDARRARARALPVRQRPAARTHEHAQQRDLGEQHAPDPLRPGPGALQPHAERGDRGVRRRRPRGDVEQRPGLAGRTARSPSSSPGSTTGPRRSSPPTSSSSRSIGELFRSQLVQQASPGQRRLRDADGGRRRRVGLRLARPALHEGDVRAADQRQGVRRPQQGHHGRQWLSNWVPRCLVAARELSAALVAARREAAALRGRPGPRQEPLQRHPVRPEPERTRRS